MAEIEPRFAKTEIASVWRARVLWTQREGVQRQDDADQSDVDSRWGCGMAMMGRLSVRGGNEVQQQLCELQERVFRE